MNEKELRKLAKKELSAYLESHEPTNVDEYFVDGYLAGARKMAEYIAHAIKFMAENNPKL